jgi:hypothetical protein
VRTNPASTASPRSIRSSAHRSPPARLDQSLGAAYLGSPRRPCLLDHARVGFDDEREVLPVVPEVEPTDVLRLARFVLPGLHEPGGRLRPRRPSVQQYLLRAFLLCRCVTAPPGRVLLLGAASFRHPSWSWSRDGSRQAGPGSGGAVLWAKAASRQSGGWGTLRGLVSDRYEHSPTFDMCVIEDPLQRASKAFDHAHDQAICTADPVGAATVISDHLHIAGFSAR